MKSNLVGFVMAGVLISMLAFAIHKQVKEHHLQDDPMLYTLKAVLDPVHPIIKNLKLYKGEKSYTINKKKIFMCLRDDKGEYYPLNMLIFVLLHEVAHQLNTYDVGHTEAFHAKFDELLDKATDIGVFNPSIPIITNYCNHD